jgi:hypothetical protein
MAHSPRDTNVSAPFGANKKRGFTSQQWILLMFSFFLGIASGFAVDKVFLNGQPSVALAHAAVAPP